MLNIGHMGQVYVGLALLSYLTPYAADDDRSVMTEQIEALLKTQSPVKTPLVERPSNKRPPGRGQGRASTPERKLNRREPVSRRPKEEEKKKKGF